MFFVKQLNFWIVGPTSPRWGQNGCILNLYFRYLTVFWVSELVFWMSELVFWVSELIFWVSELISLVLVVWTYTLGIRGPSILRTRESGNTCTEGPNILVWPVNLGILKDQGFWYDLWIWEYWRTKHSGMTCGFGNTEGPSILVWDLTFWWPAPLLDKQGILKDQAFWYGT